MTTADSASDPYKILGVTPSATDDELRGAYRRLVQRHHPDHNGGSPESARRFEAIQDAYARAVEHRRSTGTPPVAAPEPEDRPVEDLIQERIQQLERELERQRLQGEQAAHEAARQAPTARVQPPRRATPEELGYITTDDSISKILADAEEELSDRWQRSDAKRKFARRLTDLFGSGE